MSLFWGGNFLLYWNLDFCEECIVVHILKRVCSVACRHATKYFKSFPKLVKLSSEIDILIAATSLFLCSKEY